MPPDPGERLIFLHIQKTAGVGIRELLSRQYAGIPTFIRGAPNHLELFRMKRRECEAFRVVGEHYAFGLHLLFDTPSRYMAFPAIPSSGRFRIIRTSAGSRRMRGTSASTRPDFRSNNA